MQAIIPSSHRQIVSAIRDGNTSASVGSLRYRGNGPIVGRMSARRSTDSTPDLFSAAATAKPPARPAAEPAGTGPENRAPPPRQFLPKDLAGALARLEDAEIDTLVAAVTAEAKRRGRLTPTPSKDPSALGPGSVPETAVEESARLLKKGKLNAVRAAFKAGVKPSIIARQFGISKSDVRKAIASYR
jgi:hypothetical protein